MMNQQDSRGPSFRAYTVFVVVASLCLVLSFPHAAIGQPGNPGHAKAAQATSTDVIPSLAVLPRPKPLWFMPDLLDVGLLGTAVARNEIFLARDLRSNEIVAIEVRTGRAKWRAKRDQEPFELAVVGQHVLAFNLYENVLTSYAVDTGALEWTSPRVCAGPYHGGILKLMGDGKTAAGTCEMMPSGPQPPLGEAPTSAPKADVLGLDLDTGKVLWRHPAPTIHAAINSDGHMVAIASSPRRLDRTMTNTVSRLDALTGTERWISRLDNDTGTLGLGAGLVLAVGTKLHVLNDRPRIWDS